MNNPPQYTPPQEALPEYQPSLQHYGLALVKTEFLTPYHSNNAGKRNWKPVLLELNSTQLNMFELKSVDSQMQQLIVALFAQQNQLDDLAINVNQDYQSRRKPSAPDSDSLPEEPDFSGDAYGGDGSYVNEINYELSQFHSKPQDKIMKRWSQYRNSKIFTKVLPHYYDCLSDNQFLMEPTSDYNTLLTSRVASFHRGQLINSYTLDNLNLGEAPSLNQLISALYKKEDYLFTNHQQSISTLCKYKNTLRLRIECKQILLQFWSFHSMTSWFRNLTIGKDLCKPLDARSVTKLKSIPSRYSSRNNALLAASAAAASFGSSRRASSAPIQFNDPFSNTNSITTSPAPTALPLAPTSDKSVDYSPSRSNSVTNSVFSPRRESVSSSDTTLSDLDPESTTTTIHNHKFVSYENLYTPLEKQFISNCIPDLNSFDKWSGFDLTLSHYDQFMAQHAQSTNNDNVYISYSALYDYVTAFDRNFKRQAVGNGVGDGVVADGGCCRRFLIHENGLISVA